MRYAARFQKEFVSNEIGGSKAFAVRFPALKILEEAGIGVSYLLPYA